MKAPLAAAALIGLLGCSAAAAPPPCSAEPFTRFREAAAKASDTQELLPLLAAHTRKLYEEKRPGFTLAVLQQASDKKDARVESADVRDGRCTVNVAAVDASGKPRKGMYMFEAEGGQWKLLSFGWPD
jgi:hypothetical protein